MGDIEARLEVQRERTSADLAAFGAEQAALGARRAALDAEWNALREQQQKLRVTLATHAERVESLDSLAKQLAGQQQELVTARLLVAARTDELARREQELLKLANSHSDREAGIAERERDLADRHEKHRIGMHRLREIIRG